MCCIFKRKIRSFFILIKFFKNSKNFCFYDCNFCLKFCNNQKHLYKFKNPYFRRIWIWIDGTEPWTGRGRGRGSSVRGSLRSGGRQRQNDRGKGKGCQPLMGDRR
jgi:hypothetical protein